MQNYLIISGHKGFIGSNFCKILKKRKIKFLKYNFNKNYKNLSKFSHFFHFDFEIKMNKYSLGRNKKKILKILNLCSENNIKLIFPSTSSFKYYKKKRVSEKIFPFNKYCQSKIQCENLILNHYKKSKLNFLVLRIFNVYGKKINNRGVIPSIVKSLKYNNIVKLKHSENIRDFIHLDDLLKLFLKTINVNKNGIFEVGSGNIISIKNLAYRILKIFGSKSKLKLIKPFRSSNYYSKSNIRKTTKVFNWKPKIKLDKGLKLIKI